METYVTVNGVKTWYAEYGKGEPLIMLHPGGVGVDSRAFGKTIENIAKHFRVILPERRGHGRTPDAEGDYSYDLVAGDTIAFIEQVIAKSPVRILGMSDGAVVALTVAVRRPDLVERLACVAGVFSNRGWWDAIQPSDEPPDFLIDSYAGISPDGPDHYRVVHKKLNDMHWNGPNFTEGDLGKIQLRTLVMTGDDDEVSLEHAVAFYRALPKGELSIVPGTSHGLMVEKPAVCESMLLDFFENEAIETFAPIRRR